MEMTISRDAIRTDRALPVAHGTVLPTARTRAIACKPSNGTSFVSFVPAYVVGQESHPPRGQAPV